MLPSRKILKSWLLFAAMFLLSTPGAISWAGDAATICSELIQKPDNAKIYAGLYAGFQPFDFSKQPITMGEEIEAYIPLSLSIKSEQSLPNHITDPRDQARVFVAEEIARYLQSHLAEADGEELLEQEFGTVRSHIKYLAKPLKGKFWLHPAFDLFQMTYLSNDDVAVKTIGVVQDSSLFDMAGWTGVEITSPIRETTRDFELFDGIISHLEKAAELSAWPEHRAGFHIHVGTPNLSANEAALLMLSFAKVEDELKDRLGIHTSRRAFSREIPLNDLEVYLRARYPRTGPDIFDLEEIADTRDRSLNIHSLKTYGTIEFRLFDTTLNKEKRQWYRQFTRRFVEAVRSQEPAFRELLVRHQNADTIPLSEMLNALAIPWLHFNIKITSPSATEYLKLSALRGSPAA